MGRFLLRAGALSLSLGIFTLLVLHAAPTGCAKSSTVGPPPVDAASAKIDAASAKVDDASLPRESPILPASKFGKILTPPRANDPSSKYGLQLRLPATKSDPHFARSLTEDAMARHKDKGVLGILAPSNAPDGGTQAP